MVSVFIARDVGVPPNPVEPEVKKMEKLVINRPGGPAKLLGHGAAPALEQKTKTEGGVTKDEEGRAILRRNSPLPDMMVDEVEEAEQRGHLPYIVVTVPQGEGHLDLGQTADRKSEACAAGPRVGNSRAVGKPNRVVGLRRVGKSDNLCLLLVVAFVKAKSVDKCQVGDAIGGSSERRGGAESERSSPLLPYSSVKRERGVESASAKLGFPTKEGGSPRIGEVEVGPGVDYPTCQPHHRTVLVDVPHCIFPNTTEVARQRVSRRGGRATVGHLHVGLAPTGFEGKSVVQKTKLEVPGEGGGASGGASHVPPEPVDAPGDSLGLSGDPGGDGPT
jgi:hypothetical protein